MEDKRGMEGVENCRENEEERRGMCRVNDEEWRGLGGIETCRGNEEARRGMFRGNEESGEGGRSKGVLAKKRGREDE